MPKRKQQGAAGSRSGGGSKSTKSSKADRKPVILPSLFTLPEEIRNLVFSRVCSRDAKIEAAASTNWKMNFDRKMVLNLLLVSREFYDYFTPLLWAKVCISKPSALAQLHSALNSRPINGTFVKSLHLGPLSDLHENYWPVRMKDEDELPFTGDEPMVFFKTGLTKNDDKLRPRGIKADKEFAYEESDSRPAKVIREALEAVDVEVMSGFGCSDASHKDIGIVEWTKRVYTVQGALDLYLAKMRELDDVKAAADVKRVTYPRLALQGFGQKPATETSKDRKKSAKAKKDGNDFVITQEMIHAHWTRAGAHTDHFDHPLIFAKEGLRYLTCTWWEEVIVDPSQVRDSDYVKETNDEQAASTGHGAASSPGADATPATPVQAGSGSLSTSDTLPQASHTISTSSPLPASLSLDGILALGRAVIKGTPNVKNLSLTGLFYDLMKMSDSRQHNPVHLQSLICLSIGPLTPPHEARACLDEGMSLPALESLRVCGYAPGFAVATLIGGEAQGLPSLKEVQWDYGHTDEKYGGGELHLSKAFDIMRGADEAVVSSTNDHREPNRRNGLFIEARLHPSYVDALLHKASEASWELGTALRAGEPAPDALSRLRILPSHAWKDWSRHSSDYAMQRYDVLRQESQAWWKEYALEAERRGR